jgi:hypothetical protein
LLGSFGFCGSSCFPISDTFHEWIEVTGRFRAVSPDRPKPLDEGLSRPRVTFRVSGSVTVRDRRTVPPSHRHVARPRSARARFPSSMPTSVTRQPGVSVCGTVRRPSRAGTTNRCRCVPNDGPMVGRRIGPGSEFRDQVPGPVLGGSGGCRTGRIHTLRMRNVGRSDSPGAPPSRLHVALGDMAGVGDELITGGRPLGRLE